MRGSFCGWALAVLTAVLLAVPSPGQEPKAKDEKAKAADRTEADKPFDAMKDLFNGQKDMYQNHLGTLTILISVGGGFVTLLGLVMAYMQWLAQRADEKRDKKFADEQQEYLRQQNARDHERHQREIGFDRQLAAYIDKSTTYTQNSAGLIASMKTMLDMGEETRQKQAELEATRANENAGKVLKSSIFQPGYVRLLRDKWSELHYLRHTLGDQRLMPAVFVVEGLFEWKVNGNPTGAARVWEDKVLKTGSSADKDLRARTEFYLGLVLTFAADYGAAVTHLKSAIREKAGDESYKLALIQAQVYGHRSKRQTLDAGELSKMSGELKLMWEQLLQSPEKVKQGLGAMPLPVYQKWLAYTYAGFLTHEGGGTPDAFAAAKAVLDHKDNPKSAELDGIRCQIAVRENRLTVADVDGYLRRLDNELNRPNAAAEATLANHVRKARLLGRKAALLRRQGGDATDAERLTDEYLDTVREVIDDLRQETPDAAVYSPISRVHVTLDALEEQLDSRFDPKVFDDEFRPTAA